MGSELLRMGPIEEIIETALITQFIAESIPISLMLIARPGSGKSKVLLRYAGWPGVSRSDDLTGAGILSNLEDDRDDKFRFFLLPEFNKVLEHRPQVVNLTMATFLGVTSDGVTRIDDGRTKKDIPHGPVGFVSGVVPHLYNRYAQKWKQIGLHRRFLPIFYEHSLSTQNEIQDAIRDNRGGGLRQPASKILPSHIKAIAESKKSRQIACRKTLAEEIKGLSVALSIALSWEMVFKRQYVMNEQTMTNEKKGVRVPMIGEIPLPYTPHGFLRTLAASHALLNKRGAIAPVDIEFLRRLIDAATVTKGIIL